MRASADMLSGDECGEPRARSCACRCGHALVTEKVTAGYYRVSTRVRGLSGSHLAVTTSPEDFFANQIKNQKNIYRLKLFEDFKSLLLIFMPYIHNH